MILINGAPVPDPQGYQDNYDQYFTDNISLAGNRQRNRRAKKKWALMKWTMLEPTEFQALITLFNDGDAVTFSNSDSSFGSFAFTGIPDLPLEASEYMGGGTFMRDLTVTLREV